MIFHSINSRVGWLKSGGRVFDDPDRAAIPEAKP
jgi:hypothetical protein